VSEFGKTGFLKLKVFAKARKGKGSINFYDIWLMLSVENDVVRHDEELHARLVWGTSRTTDMGLAGRARWTVDRHGDCKFDCLHSGSGLQRHDALMV